MRKKDCGRSECRPCNGDGQGFKICPTRKGAEFRRVLNYERVYRIFERSKANER
ncbi:hypothetical protein AALD74_25305 [Lachnospiraceae bacterium 48-21]